VSRTSACFKANRGRLTTHNYVVGADGALADMLVFIREGLPSWHPLPAYTAATVQFTNCQIRPYQTALPWQEALRIESADGQSHTFEVAPPQGGEVATPVVPGKTAALLLTPVPQLFLPCSCRMHPWESAFVSSFDHPFYAVTGIDGRYTVTNIPPGKYVLAACHQKLTGTNGIVRTVSLRAGEVAHADFVLELPGT
jgi:hypothetical protein